jgi:Domain of unknown function (DUF397)
MTKSKKVLMIRATFRNWTSGRRGAWVKSSFSNYNGSCVQLQRLANGDVLMRDTKDHGRGPVLRLTSEEWAGMLVHSKNGTLEEKALPAPRTAPAGTR